MRLRTLVIVLAVVAFGCGSSPPPIAPVTGRVTLDGKPLAKATVEFMPIAPAGKTEAPGLGSFGQTDENGNYKLEVVSSPRVPGAIACEHNVSIRSTFAAARSSDEVGPPEKLPAKYNNATELRFTVKPGVANVADWDLKSR